MIAHQVKMGTMRGGVWGLAIVVVLLLLSMQRSEAIWSGKKDPEPAATAAGAAKQYAREAVRNTADAANNVGESIKQTANAAYETTANAARTVTGGKSDSGATGAAYRDRAGNYVVDTATATQRRAADAAGTVRDTAANSAQAARETTARAYDATADTLGSAKERIWGVPEPEPTYTQRAADAARRASQNVRDGTSRAYDATADRFTQEDDRGVYERTRDTVWGPPEPEPTYTQRAADAARRTSQNVRDGASRGYDATAGRFTQEDNRGVYEKTRDTVWGAPEPEPTYTQRAADAVRRASQNVRDGASRAYDATTAPSTREDNRGVYEKARDSASRAYDATTAPFTREDNRGMYEKARDTAYRAGQATRDSGYRAVGYEPPSEQGYASRAYDSILGSSSDAYESGKNRLGSIVEILGWTRVPEDDHNYGPVTASLGKYRSPYDVMVGDTRYVWGKQPEEPESYYQSAKATVAEKASGAANSMGKAKDATVDTASRASDSVKDMAEKTGQKGMEVVNAGAAAVGADKLVKDGFFRKLWRFVHLLTWGVTLGTAVWMTFMSGRVLQQNMPREQFRTVQTKLFPSYLRFLTAGEGVLAFLYFFLSNSSNWQTLNLLFLVGTTAYNAYVLEPQTTKIYLDRLRLEKEEGKGLTSTENVNEELDEKNKKFKELHGYSATLNLLSLAGLIYHAWNMVTRVYV